MRVTDDLAPKMAPDLQQPLCVLVKQLWFNPIQYLRVTWTILCNNIHITLPPSNIQVFVIDRFVISHDDVIKWKHFPRYRPFVRGIHRSLVYSLHKCQSRRALMFSLIYTWINGWVYNGEASDLRRHHAHYDVTITIMISHVWYKCN